MEKDDVDTLTKELVKEIVNAFLEAVIPPAKELEEALANEGFDAKSFGELAVLINHLCRHQDS